MFNFVLQGSLESLKAYSATQALQNCLTKPEYLTKLSFGYDLASTNFIRMA